MLPASWYLFRNVLAPRSNHRSIAQAPVSESLIDNLPVKAMADMAEGPIIAVDVKTTPKRHKNGPEAARARADRPPRPPSLPETLTRLLLLGSKNTAEAARRHADLVITPRAEGVGLLEFDQLDTARETGRAAAREALERASASLVALPSEMVVAVCRDR